MLMYARDGAWRHWVCAIDASRKVVSLRFLYGVRLTAPPGTLRPGSTTMGTLDLASLDQVEPGLVADLVRQAVALLDELGIAGSRRGR